MFRQEIKNEDCPSCGKTEGAYMGSSSWGHSIVCCSDECGLKVAKKIKENVNKKEYEDKFDKYYELQSELKAMRLKGIGTDYEPFFEL